MKMKNTNETIKSYLMQANSWSLEGVGANRCVEICPFPTPWMQMLIEDDWSTWWRLWMYAPSLKSAKNLAMIQWDGWGLLSILAW